MSIDFRGTSLTAAVCWTIGGRQQERAHRKAGGVAVTGVGAFGDGGNRPWGVDHCLSQFDHRRELRHRHGQIHISGGRAALDVAAAELVGLQTLPRQLVILGLERDQHALIEQVTPTKSLGTPGSLSTR